MNPTLETLSHSLDHWQALYIIAISLAVLSTFAIVMFAFHIQEHVTGLKVSNYVYVTASLFAVIATIVVVSKTKSLDAEKDRQVNLKDAAAQVQIEQAKVAAAQALASAATANQEAVETAVANSKLQVSLIHEKTAARAAEASLEAQNRETLNFAHSLAQQQATMVEQAHVSPELNGFQIQTLATLLTTFNGQDVTLHATADTTVLRLAQSIAVALKAAGITTKQYSIDMGSLYKGVSVVVHSPQDVPPMANSLVAGLRSAGIDVHPVSLDSVPAGQVALYLGPN